MEFKEKVEAFYRAIQNNEEITVKMLVREDYIQHNPSFPTGRRFVLNLMKKIQDHKMSIETIRIFQDGNFVVAHNLWRNAESLGAKEIVVIDVFRFDEKGLIAEHWDALMPNCKPNVSGRTLIDGDTLVQELEKTESNIDFMIDMFDKLINGEPEEMGRTLTHYFQTDYKQHNPDAGDGIQGFSKAMQTGELNFSFEKQHKVLAEGNFALSISEGTHQDKPAVLYDLVKITEGKVVEHWDIIQDIPLKKVNENGVFGF